MDGKNAVVQNCTLGCSNHDSLFGNGMHHACCCLLLHAVLFAVACSVQGGIIRLQNILHNKVCRMIEVIFFSRLPKDASSNRTIPNFGQTFTGVLYRPTTISL